MISEILSTYLAPKGIKFSINGIPYKYEKPFKKTETSLETELLQNKVIRKVWRKTEIYIMKSLDIDKKYLYEMGRYPQGIKIVTISARNWLRCYGS